MQTNNKYKWIIVGLVAAFLITLFFFTCNKKSDPKPKYIPIVKLVEKKIKLDSTVYWKTIDSIQRNELKWKNKFKEADGDLDLAEKQMNDILNNADYIIDSSGKEELKAQVENLKVINARKDSLCHAANDSRDSLIAEKENKYQASLDFQAKQRQSINDLIENSKAADTEIKSLNKQVRKQKANKVLYKIIAGAAIIYGTYKSL